MTQKDVDVSKIDADQAAYKLSNGKYEQTRWQDVKLQADSTLVWVDEYVGPQGVGYIVRERSADDKQTKATDYGPEGRSHDWVEVKDAL